MEHFFLSYCKRAGEGQLLGAEAAHLNKLLFVSVFFEHRFFLLCLPLLEKRSYSVVLVPALPDQAPESLQSSCAQGPPFIFCKVDGIVPTENEEITILSHDFQGVTSRPCSGTILQPWQVLRTEATISVSVVHSQLACAQCLDYLNS